MPRNFSQFENHFMARFIQKKPNRFQECFLAYSTCSNVKTPLHIALILNHNEFVTLLLQNGAFFKAKDQDTRTQIEEGLMRKQMTVFETMIAYTH